MKRGKRIVLWTLVVLLLAGGVLLVPTLWLKPWSIDHFFARVFISFALRHPMLLSQLRILEPYGLDFHSSKLGDASPEAQLREARRVERELEILRRYDPDRLTEERRLSAEILEWFLDEFARGEPFLFHDYPVNQLFGVQSNLPEFMINTHQINRPRDARNYVRRVGRFGEYFDQVIEGLELREERGLTPPRFVVRRVLDEMEAFTAGPPEEHLLVAHFRERLDELENLSERRRALLLAELEREVRETVYPVYQRLIDNFTRLEPHATEDDGVWRLPDGEAYYTHLLRRFTTTDLTPEEVHRLGLEQVESLQAEMRRILEAEGLPSEDVGATMAALAEDPRFLYPETEEGRRQILADTQAIIDEIDAGIGHLFNVRPAVGVRVERIPEFREATAPGAYYQPPPFDRSQPGRFYLNLRDMRDNPKFGMRTLTYHEAIPGHHFQIAVAQELEGVPFFRRILPFTAYTEGWALYAERLAAEAGFQDDPYDRLGYLSAQLFRAVRLVVDTGIHAERWTREEAIDYMLRTSGMPRGDVVSEVERYIVIPGQACAYMVGQLKILELRERARAELGETFDLAEFHDVVLGHGAAPLEILERLVERWIEERREAEARQTSAARM